MTELCFSRVTTPDMTGEAGDDRFPLLLRHAQHRQDEMTEASFPLSRRSTPRRAEQRRLGRLHSILRH